MVKTTSPLSPQKKTQGPLFPGERVPCNSQGSALSTCLMVYQKALELVDKPWGCCLHSELAQTCSLEWDLPISLGEGWGIAGGRSHLPA